MATPRTPPPWRSGYGRLSNCPTPNCRCVCACVFVLPWCRCLVDYVGIGQTRGRSRRWPELLPLAGTAGTALPCTPPLPPCALSTCPPFPFQALLRARGLPACECEEEEWEAQQRLKAKALLGQRVEGSTPNEMGAPGVRELPASGAAASKQQQQQQGQGQGQGLPASGAAASKQQGQGQQQPGCAVGKGKDEAATRADVQRAQGERGLRSSGKKAKKQQVGGGQVGWRGRGNLVGACGV